MEKIQSLNPKQCRRWEYADRSGFEFGDTHALAMDIQQKGQIEPVHARPVQGDKEAKYDKCHR